LNIISLFSGAGGLDLGFQKAGFNVIWSNEYDKAIWETHEKNFPLCELSKKSITEIEAKEVPDCDGIIGGPPCQSFSEAGAKRGTIDKRGQLFWDYIRILKEKKPKFFVAENVTGLMSERHKEDLEKFIQAFNDAGYDLHYKVYNAYHYGTAQSRERVIFVGLHKSLNKKFIEPAVYKQKINLEDILLGMSNPTACKAGQKTLDLSNSHEYMIGSFSSMYMSRNRVRGWSEPSFTILATARQIPIHPQAPDMVKISTDKFIFKPGFEATYRRLSVRECARIQGFPDDFLFHYNKIEDGYKMIGNAVPVNLGFVIAQQIRSLF
jgi:DNA (cytosine-5)-methyltransferase 1